jgi:hypothetical protein
MQIRSAFLLLFLTGCNEISPAIQQKPAAIIQKSNKIPLVINYNIYKAESKKLLALFKTNPDSFNKKQFLSYVSDSLLPLLVWNKLGF